MKDVAERMDALGLDYAFLGGSVVGLLLDHPEMSPVRATDDIDVVIEVISQVRYAGIEQKLRALKFDHDMRPSAPRCRWMLDNLTVDIIQRMVIFSASTPHGFREALASATRRAVPGGTLRIVSPVGFIATKYIAFLDRGADDYYASHDLEDLITVIDGREKIVDEIATADPALRNFVTKAMAALIAAENFMEALPGHLPADAASQGRLGGLRRKLTGIAASS